MNKHIALNKKEIHQFSDALKDSMSRNDIKEIALKATALVVTYPDLVQQDLKQAIEMAEQEHPQAFVGYRNNSLSRIQDISALERFINYLSDAQVKGLLNKDNKQEWVRALLPTVGGSEDSPGFILQDDLYELLHSLLSKRGADTLYIPFEERFSNTLMLGRTRSVYAESLKSSVVPHLFDLILGGVYYHHGNALLNPAFIENGKLQQFDAGFIADPLGCHGVDKELKLDSRFAVHTNSYENYLIQHAMQQVTGLLMMVTPTGAMTSSVASELVMRQWLLEQKHLKAVMSLPSGMIKNASINSVLMVFDMSQQYDTVSFITLKDSKFLHRKGRDLSLIDIDRLTSIILSDEDSDNKVTVSHADIAKQGYVLDPERYVVNEETKQAMDVIKQHQTLPLGQLVDVLRPIAIGKLKQGGGELVFEIQGGDLPDFGYIDTVSKSSSVSKEVIEELDAYILQNDDIIIIIRGSVGKVGIVSQDLIDRYQSRVIAGQASMVLRVKANSPMSSSALLMQLRSGFGQARLKLLASGTVIAGISIKDLKEFPVAILPAESHKKSAENLAKQQAFKQEIAQKQQQMQQLDNYIWL